MGLAQDSPSCVNQHDFKFMCDIPYESTCILLQLGFKQKIKIQKPYFVHFQTNVIETTYSEREVLFA